MSKSINCGSAFPTQSNAGMSLRDYFAAAALSGLAQNQEMLMANNELVAHFGTSGIDELQACKAYRLADAMLEERTKKL